MLRGIDRLKKLLRKVKFLRRESKKRRRDDHEEGEITAKDINYYRIGDLERHLKETQDSLNEMQGALNNAEQQLMQYYSTIEQQGKEIAELKNQLQLKDVLVKTALYTLKCQQDFMLQGPSQAPTQAQSQPQVQGQVQTQRVTMPPPPPSQAQYILKDPRLQ